MLASEVKPPEIIKEAASSARDADVLRTSKVLAKKQALQKVKVKQSLLKAAPKEILKK